MIAGSLSHHGFLKDAGTLTFGGLLLHPGTLVSAGDLVRNGSLAYNGLLSRDGTCYLPRNGLHSQAQRGRIISMIVGLPVLPSCANGWYPLMVRPRTDRPDSANCAQCGSEFALSRSQKRKFGLTKRAPFCCSHKCVILRSVALRDVSKRLSPRLLAYSRVQNAIDHGRLLRPDTCSNCGARPGLDAVGRSKIQAHHANGYESWADIIWLCAKCHVAVTPLPRGEKIKTAKLTENDVRLIRHLIASGGKMRHIAKQFGVTHRTICLIRDNIHWRHIR